MAFVLFIWTHLNVSLYPDQVSRCSMDSQNLSRLGLQSVLRTSRKAKVHHNNRWTQLRVNIYFILFEDNPHRPKSKQRPPSGSFWSFIDFWSKVSCFCAKICCRIGDIKFSSHSVPPTFLSAQKSARNQRTITKRFYHQSFEIFWSFLHFSQGQSPHRQPQRVEYPWRRSSILFSLQDPRRASRSWKLVSQVLSWNVQWARFARGGERVLERQSVKYGRMAENERTSDISFFNQNSLKMVIALQILWHLRHRSKVPF